MLDRLSAAEKLVLLDVCDAARAFGRWSGGELTVGAVEPDGTRVRYSIPPGTLARLEELKAELRRGFGAFERELEWELREEEGGEFDEGLFRRAQARRRELVGLPVPPSRGRRRRAARATPPTVDGSASSASWSSGGAQGLGTDISGG